MKTTIITATDFPYRGWMVEGEPLLFATRQHARDYKHEDGIPGKVVKVLVIKANE